MKSGVWITSGLELGAFAAIVIGTIALVAWREISEVIDEVRANIRAHRARKQLKLVQRNSS